MVLKWLRTMLSTTKTLVGKDHLGNSYFEVLKSSGKLRRTFESSMKHEDYVSGIIPEEWESWVNGRRKLPPTDEEIASRISTTQIIQRRAMLKHQLDEKGQAQALADGLIVKERTDPNKAVKEAMAKGPNERVLNQPPSSHASENSSYQPEAWTPGKSS